MGRLAHPLLYINFIYKVKNKGKKTMATQVQAAQAQGATTATTGKKRGRPALNSKDPKQVIVNVANKTIAINQRAIEAIKKTL